MGRMWSSSLPLTLIFLARFGHDYLGQMPWDAFVLLCSFSDSALQPAVGEGVALVELKVSFVVEKAPTCFWQDFLDSIGGDDRGGEVDEVLPPGLKPDTLVSHHRELSWLTDEQVEGAVLLVEGAKGHRVGVEVEGELQPVPASLLRLHLLCLLIPLHLLDQFLVF